MMSPKRVVPESTPVRPVSRAHWGAAMIAAFAVFLVIGLVALSVVRATTTTTARPQLGDAADAPVAVSRQLACDVDLSWAHGLEQGIDRLGIRVTGDEQRIALVQYIEEAQMNAGIDAADVGMLATFMTFPQCGALPDPQDLEKLPVVRFVTLDPEDAHDAAQIRELIPNAIVNVGMTAYPRDPTT